MVRNTASVGTVAGTGHIRKPSGERRTTYSGDERKSPFRLIVGWNSTAGQPIRSLAIFSLDDGVGTDPRLALQQFVFGAGPDAARRPSDTPEGTSWSPTIRKLVGLKCRQRPDARRRHLFDLLFHSFPFCLH